MLADVKGDRMRANTVLVIRALLLGVLTSVALAALSVLLQPELSKYSLLVTNHFQNFVLPSAKLMGLHHRSNARP